VSWPSIVAGSCTLGKTLDVAFDCLNTAGSVFLERSDSPHDFEMIVTSANNCPSPCSFSLKTVFPTEKQAQNLPLLYASYDLQEIAVSVNSGAPNLPNFLISGVGLSIATAGITAGFSLRSRDIYGNNALVPSSLGVHIASSSSFSLAASVTSSEPSLAQVSYVPTMSGTYSLYVVIGSSSSVFTLVVLSGVASSRNSAISIDSAVSTCSAGVSCLIYLTLRDSFYNSLTLPSFNFAVKVSNISTSEVHSNNGLSLVWTSSPLLSSFRLSGSYRVSRSGLYSLSVLHFVDRGLNLAMYRDDSFTEVIQYRIDSAVSFNFGSSQQQYDSRNFVWKGFLKPDNSGLHTFQLTVGQADERFRLWINDHYVLYFWDTDSASTLQSATISLASNIFYDIQLQYRNVVSASKVELQWKTPISSAFQIVSTLNLYTRERHVTGSPFNLTVLPGMACGTTSLVYGNGISLATAGLLSSFTIRAMDAFGNGPVTGNADFVVRVRSQWDSSKTDLYGDVAVIEPGIFGVSYIPRYSRSNMDSTFPWHDLLVSQALAGGLTATFYSSAPNPIKSGVFPFMNASQDSLFNSPSVPSTLRILGFIRHSTAGSYTFSFSGATFDWSQSYIDGKVISSSTQTPTIIASANSFHDINFRFTSISITTAVDLFWIYDSSYASIPTSNRYSRHDVFAQIVDHAGLAATFYGTSSFETPYSTVKGLPVGWAASGNNLTMHSSAPMLSAYSVRWRGFIKFSSIGLYSFFVRTNPADSSHIVLDSSNLYSMSAAPGSLKQELSSCTFFVPTVSQLYPIELFFKSSLGTSAFFQANWFNSGRFWSMFNALGESSLTQPAGEISSDSLFGLRSFNLVNRQDAESYFGTSLLPLCGGSSSQKSEPTYLKCLGAGYRVNDVVHVQVLSGSACAATSVMLSSNSLTLATAGSTSSFQIFCKDQFSNAAS